VWASLQSHETGAEKDCARFKHTVEPWTRTCSCVIGVYKTQINPEGLTVTAVRASAIHVTNVLRWLWPVSRFFRPTASALSLPGKTTPRGSGMYWRLPTVIPYKETGPREIPLLPGSLVDRTNEPKNISNATGDRLQTDSRSQCFSSKSDRVGFYLRAVSDKGVAHPAVIHHWKRLVSSLTVRHSFVTNRTVETSEHRKVNGFTLEWPAQVTPASAIGVGRSTNSRMRSHRRRRRHTEERVWRLRPIRRLRLYWRTRQRSLQVGYTVDLLSGLCERFCYRSLSWSQSQASQFVPIPRILAFSDVLVHKTLLRAP